MLKGEMVMEMVEAVEVVVVVAQNIQVLLL
jgi:hypothetical protein